MGRKGGCLVVDVVVVRLRWMRVVVGLGLGSGSLWVLWMKMV